MVRARRDCVVFPIPALPPGYVMPLAPPPVPIWRETEVLALRGNRERVTGVVVRRSLFSSAPDRPDRRSGLDNQRKPASAGGTRQSGVAGSRGWSARH
jgi:hypothetical protein